VRRRNVVSIADAQKREKIHETMDPKKAQELLQQVEAFVSFYERVTGDKFRPTGESQKSGPKTRRRLIPRHVPQDILPQEHTCPHCIAMGKSEEATKPIDEFGTRTVVIPPSKTNAGGTVLRYNSWCRDCRNSSDSHPTRSRFGRR
jgi:hypothetical protein